MATSKRTNNLPSPIRARVGNYDVTVAARLLCPYCSTPMGPSAVRPDFVCNSNEMSVIAICHICHHDLVRVEPVAARSLSEAAS